MDKHNDMPAEITEVTQEVPQIADDRIIEIAEKAEKRAAAIKKIKSMATAVTNRNDWLNIDGKPYLTSGGAEKIARLFGISWKVDKPEIIEDGEGHKTYIYYGHFTMGPTTVECIGTRSSKGAFYSRSKGRDVPASEIDMTNVQKAAYSNCITNGITRILGIRNMTWEEIKAEGVNQKATKGYGFDKNEETEETKEMRKSIGDMILEMAEGDKETARNILYELTTFETKDGKEIAGKKSVKDLSEKAVKVTYGKVKKEHEKYFGEESTDEA